MRNPLFVLVAASLAGCANLSVPDTGFLANREELKHSSDYDVRFVPDELELYISPDLSADDYDSILIDPVVYRPVDDPGHDPSRECIASMQGWYDDYLEEVLGEEFAIVDEPGPRTLRLRAAIAEVDPSHVLLNVITMILLVPVDMGGISGELELLDSVTGERLLAFAGYREGTIFIFFESFYRYGHTWHGMKKWTRMLRSMLADTRSSPAAADA